MTEIWGQVVQGCNPRVPYLLLAWLLVGSDNRFRINRNVDDDTLIRYISHFFVEIAMGAVVDKETLAELSDMAWDTWQGAFETRSVAQSVAGLTRLVAYAPFVTSGSIRIVLATLKARKMWKVVEISRAIIYPETRPYIASWHHIDDKAAIPIARKLMMDCLAPIECAHGTHV
jgi:hypothetical protein